MSKNIEININNGTSYETLYPKTSYTNMADVLSYNSLSNRMIVSTGTRKGDGTISYSITYPAMKVLFIILSDRKNGCVQAGDNHYPVVNGTSFSLDKLFIEESFLPMWYCNVTQLNTITSVTLGEYGMGRGLYSGTNAHIMEANLKLTTTQATFTFNQVFDNASVPVDVNYVGNLKNLTYYYSVIGFEI